MGIWDIDHTNYNLMTMYMNDMFEQMNLSMIDLCDTKLNDLFCICVINSFHNLTTK